MENITVKSSIVKKKYDTEILFKVKEETIMLIKIVKKPLYNELSFFILNFRKIWLYSRKIRKIINSLGCYVITTECLRNDYTLRLWLNWIGFEKKVMIPNYYKVNNIYYNYLLYVYKN